MIKMKKVYISSCEECPYLRYPWCGAIDKYWACGNKYNHEDVPRDEEHWLGGDANPGDRIIKDVTEIPKWCMLQDEK